MQLYIKTSAVVAERQSSYLRLTFPDYGTADFIATTRSFIFIALPKRHETVARHPFMSQ